MKTHLIRLTYLLPALFAAMAFAAGCNKPGSSGALSGQGQQSRKGEVDAGFIKELIAKSELAQREQFAKDHHKKTITLSGTVKELWPGSPVSGWFFYLETPETTAEGARPLLIQIDLNKDKFARTTFVVDQSGIGKATAKCEYPDGRGLTIKNGDTLTVTGMVWDYRDKFLNGSLLWVADAVVDK